MKIKIVFILVGFFLTINIVNAEKFKVVSIKKDTVNLMKYAENKNLFVVLYSSQYACFDCFKGIVKTLDSLQNKDKNINYIFVGNANNSSQARRKQIETINLIKKDLIIYFDVNEKIFNRYKVNTTPAIININASKINYISFDTFLKQKYDYYKVLKKYLK
jgi:hypothetical protein